MKFLYMVSKGCCGRWVDDKGNFPTLGEVVATLSRAHDFDIPVKQVVWDSLDDLGKGAFDFIWSDKESPSKFASAFQLVWSQADEVY